MNVRTFNGWQRLWLVGTVCLGLGLMGWIPLQWANKIRLYHFNFRWELEKDFRNPQCEFYQTAPIDTLRWEGLPSWEAPCWHIYVSRRNDKTEPYTLEVYDRHSSAQWWENELPQILLGIGFGTVGTILLSAFAYLCGWVVGWIYRGFRRA